MSEKVQQVASALKANLAKQFDAKPLLGDASSGDWHATGGVIDLEEMARAAIEAMRGPTKEMLTEGYAAAATAVEQREGGASLGGEAPGDTWSAMIDAALK